MKTNGKSSLVADPVESARSAGLRYVSGASRGYTRKRRGHGFTYEDAEGKVIRDAGTLRRIKSLVIPPAWTDVWICPSANGHLQATGRDARGRKQYRYHPDYRAARDQNKFNRMIAFGSALPRIRQQVENDLRSPGLRKRKVLATVVRLLETTCIRVGNDGYAKDNHSYGLTTLRNRHVTIEGRTLRFRFRGKSGQEQDVELKDEQLARIVRKMHDLPGYDLFEYLDEGGQPTKIDSEDVNDYLSEISGEDFTAKDFRTWTGTALAALALETLGGGKSKTEVKRHIVAAIKGTAALLGNHPPACRKYYVHPAILDSYADGSLLATLSRTRAGKNGHSLRREERAVMSPVKIYGDRTAKSGRKL